jgi:predicted TIM-barrel fold metal-dependent hydrolase
MLKIDINAHITPKKFLDALYKVAPSGFHSQKVIEANPSMTDLECRFRIIEKFDGYQQVLTVPGPPLVGEYINSEQAIDLAKLANNELAEIVDKYPDYFVAAVAVLPLHDIDASLKEIDRAIVDLGFRGILIPIPINCKPPDSPEFIPLYEKMARYNLPIWLHPDRDRNIADYGSEDRSRYAIFSIFGWPYDTSVAMARLAISGTLEKLPHLKIVTHHCGGMVPYFANRIEGAYDFDETRLKLKYKQNLPRPLMEYFRMFYNDTALYGNTSALMCAYDFFRAEHMLFGTDFPLDSQLGARYIRDTIDAVEKMNISNLDKLKIFRENAKALLRLPL